jgi:hypothetical protein
VLQSGWNPAILFLYGGVMQQQHTENLSEGWTAQGTMNNIIHHIFYQVT